MRAMHIVSEKQLADILEIHRITLRQWRRKGIITPCYMSGSGGASRFMYILKDVRKSLVEHGKSVDKLR